MRKLDIRKATIVVWIVALVLAVVSIFISQPTKKRPVSSPTPPFPSPSPAYTDSIQANNSFYLNRVDSPTPITGYSWLGNILVYSTPQGIFRAGSNAPLLTSPIETVSWSSNGKAILKTNGAWQIFDAAANDTKPLNLPQNSAPLTSPNGQFLLVSGNGKLTIKSLTTGEIKEKALLLRKAFWTHGNLVIVHGTDNNILVLTPSLSSIAELKLEDGEQVVTSSPDASILVIRKGTTVYTTSSPSHTQQIHPQASLEGSWLGDNAFLIETIPDPVGRYINYLWTLNPSGEKMYITNTQAIPRKLASNQLLMANISQSVLPLIEKQGNLWLLATTPNQLPSYTNEGLFFTPMSPQHRDGI